MTSARRGRGLVPLVVTLVLARIALDAVPAYAQTLITGAVEGTAASAQGPRLADVDLVLTDRATGWARTVTTDAAGRFRIGALAPGSYDLMAERLGFRPVVVSGITVTPGSSVGLELRLTPAEPPVTTVDSIAFVEGALNYSLARGTWSRGADLLDLADPQGRLTSLAEVAAVSNGGLTLEGLPDRLGVTAIDGVPRAAAAHPGASRTDLAALVVSFTTLDHAEIISGMDVEWPGFGGGLLGGFSARGLRRPQVRSYADVANGALRGGLVAGGPLVRDTARVLLGVDFRRLETELAAPWRSDSAAALAVAIARDSFAEDLSSYLRPVTERTDVLTGFGRLDWEVAEGQAVSLRAAVADRSSRDLALGAGRPLGLGTSLEARDISGSAALSSRLARNVESRLSVSLERSRREYGGPALPGTVLAGDALFAGADGALPGQFERNAFRASAALLYRRGAHHFKLGLTGSWSDHDITYAPWRAGSYVFGSVDDLVQRRGAFVQAVGGVPAAEFTVASAAGFLQDSWTPLRELDVLIGVRIEREGYATDRVRPDLDQEWLRLTGLSNTQINRPKQRASPRFAFTWSAGPRREWLLYGEAGLFTESVDPAVLAELVADDGTVKYRRGLGALGAWPGVPDSSAAPLTGPVLTLLNSRFEAPRTARVGLSIARALAGGASLQVAARYRHSQFLPRRSDLNQVPAPVLRDQDGRPIYGALEQHGGMLAARPGSNRRFADFDRVWAIDPSGFSQYWGVTTTVERVREPGFSLWASYTYSRTTDNWPGAMGSVPELQLTPLPDSLGASDWRDGRSDLDVPHRGVLGVQWASGGSLGVRLSALTRYRSGAPFTPGFRDGVDANGDGAWGNDPAFVSDTVAGAAALIGASGCLRRQIGRLAERNSCRAPAVASVDVRLAIRLFSVFGGPAEVVVDGLNLVTADEGVVDRALYLVDPARTLATNAGTGVVTVPLVINPNFGKLLVRRSPDRMVRAGLRLGF